MNVFASCPNIYFTQRVNRNFYLQKLQPNNKVEQLFYTCALTTSINAYSTIVTILAPSYHK